jgi:hypothetical protein
MREVDLLQVGGHPTRSEFDHAAGAGAPADMDVHSQRRPATRRVAATLRVADGKSRPAPSPPAMGRGLGP